MSYETRKPNIKLAVSYQWFDLLIFTLKKNTKITTVPSIVQSADALIDKLMKYSRPYTDIETDVPFVDMRFFPSKASEMMWQLLIGCDSFGSDGDCEDYYLQLIENHKSKEPKNTTE